MPDSQPIEPFKKPAPLPEEEHGLLDEEETRDRVRGVGKVWGVRKEIALFAAGVCGLVFGAALVLIVQTWNSQPNVTDESQLVQLPIESVVFRRNQSYIDPSTPESDALWESLIPGDGSAHGFATIDNPQRYGLPRGAPKDSNKQSFGVSMYHQLHCLISIRDIFWGVLTGKYNATEFGIPDSDLNMRVNGHTGHCFDYLRQGIQCASDISFEGIAEGTEKSFTGWDMEHKNCRSFSAGRAFMEAHQPAQE